MSKNKQRISMLVTIVIGIVIGFVGYNIYSQETENKHIEEADGTIVKDSAVGENNIGFSEAICYEIKSILQADDSLKINEARSRLVNALGKSEYADKILRVRNYYGKASSVSIKRTYSTEDMNSSNVNTLTLLTSIKVRNSVQLLRFSVEFTMEQYENQTVYNVTDVNIAEQ